MDSPAYRITVYYTVFMFRRTDKTVISLASRPCRIPPFDRDSECNDANVACHVYRITVYCTIYDPKIAEEELSCQRKKYAVRELIGAGSIFGHQILPLADAAAGKAGYEPITIFILAPGAFFVLAALSALQNKFKIGAAKRGIDPSNPDCGGSCAACGNTMCKGKRG